MQHKVPQYIEVEDKIFGPFTTKQFSYLALGFGLCIMLWRLFSESSLLLFILAPVVGFTLALTFLKPNGKPFIYVVQNFVYYVLKPKKLYWKNPGSSESRRNVENIKQQREADNKKDVRVAQKFFSATQIKNIANKLDK
jgi:hypothetical protein